MRIPNTTRDKQIGHDFVFDRTNPVLYIYENKNKITSELVDLLAKYYCIIGLRMSDRNSIDDITIFSGSGLSGTPPGTKYKSDIKEIDQKTILEEWF